jgi:hypothetical protein
MSIARTFSFFQEETGRKRAYGFTFKVFKRIFSDRSRAEFPKHMVRGPPVVRLHLQSQGILCMHK